LSQFVDAQFLFQFRDRIHYLEESVLAGQFIFLLFEIVTQRIVSWAETEKVSQFTLPGKSPAP